MSHGSEPTTKNRLARESSPYLLLHRGNPVDWYPWGPEALEKAHRENKPIFLSVGYSTCYWCHVMERESFSDPAIAEILNEHFVSIKVDREERPDLDDVYMTATQILTSRGGWPNSVFLTPELKPFYAGTYFPPEDRHGLPGFRSLLENMTEAWKNRRSELEQHADEVSGAMEKYFEGREQASETVPGAASAVRSLDALSKRFDAEWGGFGGAPKFPSPSNLYLLLDLAEEHPKAAHMLHQTLDEMARGGIYDQLGGGFHRYATDREWKIPHFEKMLYDNGFLLELYAREHGRTGDPEMARIARETAQWMIREMTGEHGAFFSAIDAETDGKEGAFYAWTREDLDQVLGEEDAEFLAPVYGFDRPPFFEGDEYVLHLPRPLTETAEARKMSRRALLDEIAPMKTRLFEARADRKRPLTDDKILTDWNGIAVTGMAVAGRVLGDEDLVDRAARAARFVLREMRGNSNGGEPTLLHTYRAGEAKLDAYLGDYAFMIRGLLALHEATGEAEWLHGARDLAEEQVRRLRDAEGGFFNAAPDDNVLFRPKETFDGAMPAANSVAALNFLELADRLDAADSSEAATRWRREAEDTLRSYGRIVENYPDAVRMATVAAHRLGAGVDGGDDVEAARGGPAVSATAAMLAQQGLKKVVSKLRLEDAADGLQPFVLTLEIEDGWHVNANPASADFLVPTDLDATGAKLEGVSYPEGRSFAAEFADGEISVYEGTVEITGKILPTTDEPVLRLTFQACDAEKCLPPVTREMGVR